MQRVPACYRRLSFINVDNQVTVSYLYGVFLVQSVFNVRSNSFLLMFIALTAHQPHEQLSGLSVPEGKP